MTSSTASTRSKKLSANRVSALFAAMLVWSCASLAAAETPAQSATASMQVSVQVIAKCDIKNDGIPSASCVGTHNPMIDTAPAVVANGAGEMVSVLVTTMNF